ncbi:MAG: ubiquinol-cytochrome c reductase iron-sulfur subunit [Thermodesulfobacteriota bacterium]
MKGYWRCRRYAPIFAVLSGGMRQQRALIVRCHGAHFNAVGEVLAGPPPRPLDIHSVMIVEEKIVVDTSKVIKRKKFDRTQLIRV